jgi:hypothetical protein
MMMMMTTEGDLYFLRVENYWKNPLVEQQSECESMYFFDTNLIYPSILYEMKFFSMTDFKPTEITMNFHFVWLQSCRLSKNPMSKISKIAHRIKKTPRDQTTKH